MPKDIARILDGWDYVPDQVTVRVVIGDDGEEKIQMRLDLGLLQMELHGRPDGFRPEGKESWLEYYEEQSRDNPGFVLTTEDCDRLLREGIQYYHRYLSFWNLKRYELCARDTQRNLRLFAFVRQFAGDDREKLQFDQWRPYVTMMHTRAVATPLIQAGRIPAALEAIDEGIRQILAFLKEYKQLRRAHECAELGFLEQWKKELESPADSAELEEELPLTQMQLLQSQLNEAIAAERFEEAARLRDEIRRLT